MGAASGDPSGGAMPMMEPNQLQFIKSPYKPFKRLSVLGVVVSKYNIEINLMILILEAMEITFKA